MSMQNLQYGQTNTNAGTWSPSVVIGIDFGMTCTGVAYACADSGWARPEVIQEWPNSREAAIDKFPSRVAYGRNNRVVDWGCCDTARDIVTIEREFKLHLNPAFRDHDGDLTHEAAVQVYIHYMEALYQHLNRIFTERFRQWSERQVEYRFSIPTTWKNPRLTNQLKSWVAKAGFVNTRNRRVIFSRTEAESAAVYVADQYHKGDVIMIVDAGGATTDVNILEVIEKEGDVTQMRPLHKDEGINVGAVIIDAQAKILIEQKLRSLQRYTDPQLRWLVNKMIEVSGFELFKCSFSRESLSTDFYMSIPEAPGQRIILKASELKTIFDGLIGELIKFIGGKMRSLPNDQRIQYLVLSGGLGSSRYVRERLTDAFCTSTPGTRGSRGLQILVADEPQLAVVKGLVMDRSQALGHDVSPWKGRCCPVSYGVLCKRPYDGRIHHFEPTVKDPNTGQLLVEDQIDWLIEEGKLIDENGITRPYTVRISNGKRYETFNVHIVMSEDPASNLPRSRHRGTVSRVCTVQGRFSPEDFTAGDAIPKSGLLHRKKAPEMAHFKLKVIIGSTDMSFEFVSMDGKRRYDQSSEKVDVLWDEPRPSSPQIQNYSRIFPSVLQTR